MKLKLTFCTLVILSFLFSCKKTDSNNTATPATPAIDTTALLTNRRWVLTHEGNDFNSDGKVDSTEWYYPGTLVLLTLYADGHEKMENVRAADTPAVFGYWRYTTGNKSTFIITVDSIDHWQLRIDRLSDTKAILNSGFSTDPPFTWVMER